MAPKFLASRTWFAQIHPTTLVALLRPWKALLLEHGINLDKTDWQKRSCLALHDVLVNTKELPTDLREMLMAVVSMSTHEGHTLLVDVAEQAAWDYGQPPGWGWTCQNLAAHFWIEQRPLFDRAVATMRVHHSRTWHDFFDASRGDLSLRVNGKSKAQLEEQLREHWHGRQRAAFAEVRLATIDHALTFLISHAELLHSQVVIAEDNRAREVVRINPEVSDVARYAPESGRLSVNTRYGVDARAIAAIVGEVFWGDAERYQELSTYSGQPLLERGSEALRDPAGKFKVRIKSCTLLDPSESLRQLIVKSVQPGPELERHLTHARNEGLTYVSGLCLGFKFDRWRAEVEVAIGDHNKLRMPRHLTQSETVFRFLLDQSFARQPGAGVRS